MEVDFQLMSKFEKRLQRRIEEATVSAVGPRASSREKSSADLEQEVDEKLEDLEAGDNPEDPKVKEHLNKSRIAAQALRKAVMQSILSRELADLGESFEQIHPGLDEAVDKIYNRYYGYLSEE